MNHEGVQRPTDWLTGEAAEFCPYCMSRVAPGENCPVCGLTQGTYAPAPHHLPLGTILAGRYLVGRVLGEGGFGITYIGCDLRLEMKVAIKEYFPVDRVSRYAGCSLSVVSRVGTTARDYDQGLKRFLQEARTMARMEKQPEIVMVRDYFEANSTAYIVMEYVEGTNFMDLTDQYGGRIPPEKLFPLLRPLFAALGAVHGAGLIHRDISPDNLMLERGSVRLLDFGCARESARGTETMTIALKQGFAPIEQYQRKGQGPWTDVYALSATIYYCLTGKVPPQSLDRILEDELIEPRALGVKITPRQQDALLRGMSIQPRRRYQTIEELYAGLYQTETPQPEPTHQDVLTQTQDTREEPEPPRAKVEKSDGTPASIWRTHRRVLTGICAGVVALGLCMALILWGMRNQGGEPGQTGENPSFGTQQDLTTLDREKLFADAVTVTTEQELMEALADKSVPAVICENQIFVDWSLGRELRDANGNLEISKPVLVSDGCILEHYSAFDVTQGGVLWAAGTVKGLGAVLTTGGSVIADTTGVVEVPVFLHEQTSMLEQEGSQILAPVYPLSQRERFEDATVVTTADQLKEASQDLSVSAIRVEGDISLTETVTARVPLWVAAESTVSSTVKGVGLYLEHTVLENDGTVKSDVWLEGVESQMINRGTLDTPSILWVDDKSESAKPQPLINTGEIFVTEYQDIWCDVMNLGRVTVKETADGGLNFDRSSWYNYGLLDVQGGQVNAGGLFYNLGTLQLAGSMELAGLLKNNGNLTVTGQGTLTNMGLIDCYDYGGALWVERGATLDTNRGVFLTREGNDLSGSIDGRVWSVDFNAIDGSDVQRAQAEDAQELMAALADEKVDMVEVTGDVTVEKDLTVTKPVYVNGGILTMEGGSAMTVDGTILCVNGTLNCDHLTVENRGMVEVIGAWNTGEDGGQLQVAGKSWVYTRNSHLDLRDLTVSETSMVVYDHAEGTHPKKIHLSGESQLVYLGEPAQWDQGTLTLENSQLIQLADLTFSNAQIHVDDGSSFHQCGDLTLDGGAVTIDRGGEFYSCCGLLSIGEDVAVENHGDIRTNDFTDQTPMMVHGVLNNYGSLVLGDMVEIRGTLENRGRIYSFFEERSPVTVKESGVFSGETDILSAREWISS